MKKVTKNIKETEAIAEFFLAKILKKQTKNTGAVVVALSGELGAGKTVFTQAVAKHLGIKSKVTSPTFVILKKYPVSDRARYRASLTPNKKYKFLVHIDAYRLKDEKELLNLKWEDLVNNSENLILIEWPENVSKAMPKNVSYIYISHLKDEHRQLELK